MAENLQLRKENFTNLLNKMYAKKDMLLTKEQKDKLVKESYMFIEEDFVEVIIK